MKLNDIKAERAEKLREMQSLTDKAGGENRDLSGEERTRFTALEGKVRALGNRLSDAEKQAEFERMEASGQPAGEAFAGDLSGYSVAKAVMEHRAGAPDGGRGRVACRTRQGSRRGARRECPHGRHPARRDARPQDDDAGRRAGQQHGRARPGRHD